jgi:hypothetical protein
MMTQSTNPPPEAAKTREAKLAEALRANLRRRKAADRTAPSTPQKPEPTDS